MDAEVRLTQYELFSAAMVGVKRQIDAISKRLPDKHGYNGDGWSIHIEGAAGEMALAKALGIYYGGTVNTFKSVGDVGDLEVRTRSRDDYDLIVRDDDPDRSIFVLVIGKAPDYHVIGWIRGIDAKQEVYRQTYGNREPAYFVPQGHLHSLDELIALRFNGLL